MIILPAIDLHGGKCVRLYKGDFATAEQVADDPFETADWFYNAGAKWMHMVDLDGAKTGVPAHSELIKRLVAEKKLQIEIGGGIRNMKTAESYITAGVSRIILGSAALSSPEFVKEAVLTFGDRVAVGIDAKNGMASAEGWLADSAVDYIELAKQMEAVGVSTIIYTDISKDGTLSGPNTAHLEALHKAVGCQIIASGGIHNIGDIEALSAIGMYGAICGKSIYKGTLDLKEAIEKAGKQCS